MASPENDGNTNQYFVQEIDYNEIEKLEAVGEGSFGVVYKGIWRDTFVAVKNIVSQNDKDFIVEVRQLSRVNHENIVKLYGACTKSPNICLVMEYAEGGSLFNILHHAPGVRYTLAHSISWLYQCAKGVRYLHGMKPKPLIHRDLKPPNLLLVQGGTLLKICDFGTVADKTAIMTNNKGSAAWMAPEVFETSNYTEKCDVFSWGIILWEVLSRLKPFFHIRPSGSPSAYMILWAKHTGSRPPLIRNCPKQIEQLMTQCWDQDATKRPSMCEIVERMEFFCNLLPGADEPLQNDDGDDVIYDQYYYDDDNDEKIEEQEYNNENIYGIDDSNDNNRENVRILPQPSDDINRPLTLDIDPNAWQLEENDVEVELKTMPGFDRMVPINGSTNSVQAGIQSTTTTKTKDCPDPDLDRMYMLLDPHLRPATPDPQDPQSMALFEEHKQLAQEYLTVQTELALLSQKKNKLLAVQSEEQQKQRKTLKELQAEKESLILVRELLKKQKELAAGSSRNINNNNSNNRGTNTDNWVLVPRQTDNLE